MKRSRFLMIPLFLIFISSPSELRADGPYAKGFRQSPGDFPIAVWLQDPAKAAKYREIGINLYVGLWRGPTEDQLKALDQAGVRLICGQTPKALTFRDRPTIVGWMHGDEPDNAQSLGKGKGYGPPIPPADIIKDYEAIRKTDPDRPVLLNLGQGVAWDGWYGRGVRTNHPEDYPLYIKGCDIASFDIYPAVHDKPEIAGKLWYVPQGVERLKRWSDGTKEVWACIETTRISNPNRKPTPQQVRSEVWMAIIRGAKGIIYFSHEFRPKFVEAGLLADPAISREVRAVNGLIRDLAPVLNGPDVIGADNVATVTSNDAGKPVAVMQKRHDGKTYLFVAALRDGNTVVRIALPKNRSQTENNAEQVEVIGENRTIRAVDGAWSEDFSDYQVHIYRVGS